MDIYRQAIVRAYTDLFRALVVDNDHGHEVRDAEAWARQKTSWFNSINIRFESIDDMLKVLQWALATRREVRHPADVIRNLERWKKIMQNAERKGPKPMPQSFPKNEKSTWNGHEQYMAAFKAACEGKQEGENEGQ